MATAEPRPGWTLFHNAALIGRIDPNHASGFRAAEGAGPAITREIIAFYEDLGARPAAYVDVLGPPTTWCPASLPLAFARGQGRRAT